MRLGFGRQEPNRPVVLKSEPILMEFGQQAIGKQKYFRINQIKELYQFQRTQGYLRARLTTFATAPVANSTMCAPIISIAARSSFA